MSDRDPHAHDVGDDELLALLRDVPRPAPSLGDAARLGRAVSAAVRKDAAARRRAVSPAFLAAAVFCAGAASAGTALLLTSPSSPPPAVTTTTPPTHTTTQTSAAAAPTPPPVVDVIAAAPVVVDAVAKAPPPKAAKKKPKPPPAPPTWEQQAEQLETQGDLRGAAAVAARALGDDESARAAGVVLWGLAARDSSVVDALDAGAVGDVDDADDDGLRRVLKLGCELRLRYRRDEGAIAACRTFGQRFPADPAARALAFGAGGLAEELGALDSAVDEYTRAIVLAPLLGGNGNDALLARARVRARRGDLDEARADLRVYLQKDPRPAQTHTDEVQGLARSLRVELP